MSPDSESAGRPEPPMAAQVMYQPPRAKSRPALRVLVLLLVLGLCGSLALNVLLFGLVGLTSFASLDSGHRVRERVFSHQKDARQKVAIISVEGTILSGEGFVKRQIDRARKDPYVRAVVLRVDSPGGTITGSDYIYHHLRELRQKSNIPIVVSMGGLAASGGYYIAMACGHTPDVIFAEPTTWTGSIGVLIPHYDLSKMLENWGIVQDSITSGPLKSLGSFTKPMTPQERQILQKLVDDGYALFKEVIRKGRPAFQKDPQALGKVASGQVFTANQALENGLVDKIGFIEDAVDRAIELANLDAENVKVVEYRREPNLADLLIGAELRSRPPDLATLLDLTAPRGYYLCTWLPPLASSSN